MCQIESALFSEPSNFIFTYLLATYSKVIKDAEPSRTVKFYLQEGVRSERLTPNIMELVKNHGLPLNKSTFIQQICVKHPLHTMLPTCNFTLEPRLEYGPC